jgi:type II secretory pathway pseudopilin PulG
MKKTFTLIELLIYISIFSLILVFLLGFFWDTIFSKIRGDVFQEIQEQGYFAIFKIQREIKRAKSVNFPFQGNSGNYLSLDMPDPDTNRTVFDLQDGKLRITQGTNLSYFLTSDSVKVDDLSFSNLSFSNTPGIIKIEIRISSLNPFYQNSITFKSSCALLPNK